MDQIIISIVKNKILMTSIIAWIFAQCVKVILGIIREKRFDFRWVVGTGGFPSSHASGVGALATSCGLNFGFSSPIFALACVFAFVTMFDAQSARRAIGKQAEILNKILEDIYWQRKIRQERLKELIGHTPFEVISGAIMGILIAIALHQ